MNTATDAVQEWMVKTMRLIDADALVQALHKAGTVMGQPHFLCRTVYECINNAPIVDAVTVVRCKDCKWWTKQEESIQGRCALAGIYPTGGWYCGNGKREDNE